LFTSNFKKNKNRPLSYESVRAVYEKARKKVGIKNGEGIHTLRHSGVYPPLEGHPSPGSRIRYQKNTSAVGSCEADHHHDLPTCEP
jgi:integrase